MPKSELTYGLKDVDRDRIIALINVIRGLSARADSLRVEIYSQLDS
jgi:hypothetical protein